MSAAAAVTGAAEPVARVAPADARRAGPLLRLAARVARHRYGAVPTPVLVAARSRWSLRGMLAYEMAIDRARALDVGVEDLAVLRAAEVISCEYCRDIGRAVLAGHGDTAQRIEAAAAGDATGLNDLERTVLRYAEAMSNTPVMVDDAMVDELRCHLNDEQIVELTAAIAWENHRARFNAALGIVPQGFAASCGIAAAPRSGDVVVDGSAHPLQSGEQARA